MELIFVWLVCGIITAAIGSNKGRSGCGWFIVGILLGPLGIILALVMSPNVAQVEQQSLKSGESRKCPYCAELVKREAIVCKHCGRDLPAPGEEPGGRGLFGIG